MMATMKWILTWRPLKNFLEAVFGMSRMRRIMAARMARNVKIDRAWIPMNHAARKEMFLFMGNKGTDWNEK